MIKLVASKKLSPDKEMGIKGFIVRAEIIKSRSNFAGISCELVFDQVNGFDNILSNFLLLKANKMINGGGKSYYVDGYEETKFAQSTYRQTYLDDENFAAHVDEVVRDLLEASIPTPEKYGAEVDLDGENKRAFEGFKKTEKLIEVEYDGFEGIYWEHPTSGDVYDSDGEVVEFD